MNDEHKRNCLPSKLELDVESLLLNTDMSTIEKLIQALQIILSLIRSDCFLQIPMYLLDGTNQIFVLLSGHHSILVILVR